MAVDDFSVNFAPIGNLANVYRQAQQRGNIEQMFPGSGGDLSLARLAQQHQQDQRDFAFRQQEAQRLQGNVDRSAGFDQRRVDIAEKAARTAADEPKLYDVFSPEGLPQKATYDPATKQFTPVGGTKEKGKDFQFDDIEKLTKEGGKFSSLAGFTQTFEDRFAGYKLPGAGRAATLAGRLLPEEVVGPDVAQGASWWQGYDRYKNVVRNELFGASLTPGETAAFEAADITPGMDPKQIKKNLDIQHGLIKDAMKRKAGALVAGGFKPEPIARAYGLKLEDLGVDTTKKGATPAGRADAAPPIPNAKQGNDGNWYVPDPNRPGKFLKVNP